MKKTLIVIPARGNSKAIPRKNLRFLAGKPLIAYSIQNALQCSFASDVVVTTDDDEIKYVSMKYGAQVIDRPTELGYDDVTLDPVVYDALKQVEKGKNTCYDIVITLQPTSPLLTTNTLEDAFKCFIAKDVDALISAINRPSLAWTETSEGYMPLYKKRVNRQYLPKYFVETGAFVISKRKYVNTESRFGDNNLIYEIPENEAVDIDSYNDLFIAEKELIKKHVLFRVDGYTEIGLGHIYRCLTLAYQMTDCIIRFVLNEKSDIGIKKIADSFFPYDVIRNNEDILNLAVKYKTDIVINDILDTERDYIEKLKSISLRVINFEDLGSGADHADIVINDLYEKQKDGNHFLWGSKYYCIRDEFHLCTAKSFISLVENVLIIFGGTDPANLTTRLYNIVKKLNLQNIKFTFILGLGNTNFKEDFNDQFHHNIEVIRDVKTITKYIAEADMAISSQGRTMLELACLEVPSILIAQNDRELNHKFGEISNGFINLGCHNEVDDATIQETLEWLINCPQMRKHLKSQMHRISTDLKNGTEIVKKIILS